MSRSYDNSVRLFDARKPLSPVAQADVGGGAWRVKWHPSATRNTDLLVACMHDGFKIVRFGLEPIVDRCDIIKRYDAHESLAYGVDWSFATGGNTDSNTMIASCSFYDHALHLWSG
jgi:diphthine methyl ester acylhydrolase